MAIQTVKTGAAVNDGTGDDARTAFTKINQNFTNNAHAASRMMGVEGFQVPDANATRRAFASIPAIEVGSGYDFNTIAFGDYIFLNGTAGKLNAPPFKSSLGAVYATKIYSDDGQLSVLGIDYIDGGLITRAKNNGRWSPWNPHWHKTNTTVDGNGFIKAASPIIELFADKVELNDEAAQQKITFEKLGVGDYLIKGSTGFAQEGWYIEMPKDANGNVLVAVVYEQLANNDISVKTYAKMFDEETGDIVANTAKPRDIPSTRWIDLRLQELPQDDVQPLDTDETVNTNAE